MATRLTDRDTRILAKCAVCRWLTTDQIRRLYFPGSTLNAVQKRLRKLADDGYLRSHREHPTAEAVHAVGPKGKEVVEERGIEAVLGEEAPRQIEHLVGVNDIRIAVESSAVPVAFFFAYFQLASLGWKHAVIPDAVFALKGRERQAYLIEYDRGTEPLGKLLQKLRSYAGGLPGFPFQSVMIVTERTRRLDMLSRELRREGIRLVVLAGTLDAIREAGLLEAAFVQLPDGGQRKLLDPCAEGGSG
jgi:hypothetical protein